MLLVFRYPGQRPGCPRSYGCIYGHPKERSLTYVQPYPSAPLNVSLPSTARRPYSGPHHLDRSVPFTMAATLSLPQRLRHLNKMLIFLMLFVLLGFSTAAPIFT